MNERTKLFEKHPTGGKDHSDEVKAFAALKCELETAFSQPDTTYVSLTAVEVIERNQT